MLGCRLSALHSPQNILGQGYWKQRDSKGGWSLSAEATSHLGTTHEDSLEVASALYSAGLGSEGQKRKEEGVSLLPGGWSSPGKLVFVAEEMPGKIHSLQRRQCAKGGL